MTELPSEESKKSVFEKIRKFIETKGFTIDSYDQNRPWGGFFVIRENESGKFISEFFSHLEDRKVNDYTRLSPKILLVAPHKRLSWQYHHRRAEIWRVVNGPVGVVVSETDEQTPAKTLSEGDHIQLQKGERHRLVGLEHWGVVAEIWQHTDPDNPSDEDDIVRLEDDFGR